MTKRQEWDDYFLDIAEKVATRATCPRLSVGAVVVKDHRIVSTGYNGSTPGAPHCIDEGCIMSNGHCVRTIHAEMNAILEAGRGGARGSTLYCTHRPCSGCWELINRYDVAHVKWRTEYP